MQDINLASPEMFSAPYPVLARLRAHPTLVKAAPMNGYVVSRYDDVLAVLKDPQRYSSEGLRAVGEPPWLGRNYLARAMVAMNPPRHTKLRALVNRAFGPTRLARLEGRIRGWADEFAAAAVEQGQVDFIDAFSIALPRAVIGHLLGLEASTYPKMKRWSTAMATVTTASMPAQQEEIRSALREMEGELSAVIAARRKSPGEDMVSELLRAEVDGEVLTDEELMSFLFLLLPAGMETTTHLLGNAAVLLAGHPEELERARQDPSYIPLFIEEVLRFESPVRNVYRIPMVDVEISGTKIPAGSLVVPLLSSANRDESVFPDADRFRPGREKVGQILSFGYGIHFCMGAALARMEARHGLEALLSRIRGLRLLTPEVSWLPSMAVRGPQTLPVELIRA
jgi:cytochrome P450